MSRSHYMVPTLALPDAHTVRLGAAGSANYFKSLDIGKFVKLAGESMYDLCAAGDEIEAQVQSVDQAPQNDQSIGGVAMFQASDRMWVLADGLQATPGTGTLAVGDYVVVGSVTAKGTLLATYPKVCKATSQGTQKKLWRVVSLGSAGTGAVGTSMVIQRES